MLYQNIQMSIKEAMKSKDTDKRDVLKMAVSKSQAIAKEQKCDITDAIMLDGIRKELKQLNQTKDSLVGKEDSDLYKSTICKIDILNGYLPKMMSEEETIEAIKNILLGSGNTDFSTLNKGMAMKMVMPELKGKADNKTISKCIDSFLGGTINVR